MFSCHKRTGCTSKNRRRSDLFKDSNCKKKRLDIKKSKMCHISHLPTELLEMIFSYLSINDRLTAALVCKDWHSTLNTPPLVNDLCVYIDKPLHLDQEYEAFTRSFSSFHFKDIFISMDFVEFLEKYSPNLKHLIFEKCKVDQNLKLDILRITCQNLVKLKFYMCFVNLFHSLPALKDLHVDLFCKEKTSSPCITMADVEHLNNTMPNLERLYLSLNDDISIPEDWKVEEEDELLIEYERWLESFYGTTLSLPIIMDFIEKRSTTLNEVTVFDQSMKHHNIIFQRLFRMPDLKLRKLSFGELVDYVDPSTAIQICRSFSSLREICFSMFTDLDDESLKAICTALPALEVLVLEGNIDTSIEDVFKLKNLRSLTLERCFGIQRQSFSKAVAAYQMHKLATFKLTLVKIEDCVLREVLGKMTKLRNLRLNNNMEMFTTSVLSNESMRFISKNLVYLENLALLDGSVSDEGLICPEDPTQSISNLKGLKKLKLMNQNVTSEGLLQAVKFLELRIFHFDFFNSSKRYKNSFANRLMDQNPSLKALRMFPSRRDKLKHFKSLVRRNAGNML